MPFEQRIRIEWHCIHEQPCDSLVRTSDSLPERPKKWEEHRATACHPTNKLAELTWSRVADWGREKL